MIERTDDLGHTIRLPGPAQRIVCLVPSITETLFALGAGDRVAGITEYCIHPSDGVKDKERVGGTKTILVEKILALNPDLVIANAEENRRHQVARLSESGLTVFVTFPKTVEDTVKMLADVAALTDTGEAAQEMMREVQAALREARALAPSHPPAVLCPIWKNPYMSVNRDTFVHSVLRAAGGRNVFENDEERYPVFTLGRLRSLQPDIILLPTEPYHFVESEKEDFYSLGNEIPAVRFGEIHIVEGELLSWYGPRVPRALRELSHLIRSVALNASRTAR